MSVLALSQESAQKVERALEVCLPTLRENFKWVDTMTGFQGTPVSACTTPYGLAMWYGMAQPPEGGDVLGLRVAKKHSYRLTGALSPGSTLTDYEECVSFLYRAARVLGAPEAGAMELTNSFLTRFGNEDSTLLPGFRTPDGCVITLSWLYQG